MGRPADNDDRPPFVDEPDDASGTETTSLRSVVSLQTYDGEESDAETLPAYQDDQEPNIPDDDSQSNTRPPRSEIGAEHGEAVRHLRGVQHTSDWLFSSNADALYALILDQTAVPPRPIIRFQGHHNEKQRKQDGRDEVRNVTDFDVQLDCQDRLMYGEDGVRKGANWVKWKTVADHDKTRRGGFFKSRAKAKIRSATASMEAGEESLEARTQALRNWCHIFTARASRSSAFPCTFQLDRTVTNWNTDLLRDRLMAMARKTNYRGNLLVDVKTEDTTFVVYSAHWMNSGRNNVYMYWACIIFQLWILTWPILWLCTGTFSVVKADWPYKTPSGQRTDASQPRWLYASISEQRFLDTWGHVLVDAAFARRQGCVVLEDYDRVMQLREAERTEAMPSVERRPSETGNAAVDTAVGIFAGISGAREERDLALGWGVDCNGSASMNWSSVRSKFGKRIQLE